MIAKADWFSPRKFGWGLGIRKKEGVFYIGALIAVVFAAATMLPEAIRPYGTGAIMALLIIDVMSILPEVYRKLDEREAHHQLVAERNASFAAVVSLVSIILYASLPSFQGVAPDQGLIIVPVIVLLAMSAAKGITLLHKERVN